MTEPKPAARLELEHEESPQCDDFLDGLDYEIAMSVTVLRKVPLSILLGSLIAVSVLSWCLFQAIILMAKQ